MKYSSIEMSYDILQRRHASPANNKLTPEHVFSPSPRMIIINELTPTPSHRTNTHMVTVAKLNSIL